MFVERYTPPPFVPANKFDPIIEKDVTFKFVNPVLIAVQLLPLFVDKNKPS